MALKNLMNTFKLEGYIVHRIDQYLLSLDAKDEDRRYDINSPSSAGACPREVVYSRLAYERDAMSIDARTRRVFDNGTGTHERLQKYMLDSDILAMDEVPLFDDEYSVQGHTDGLLNLSKYERGILEIKTINTDNFKKLVDAKEEHKLQGSIYMYCLENRRKHLKKKFKSRQALLKYLASKSYINFIRDHYPQLKDGSHFSAEEKFKFKLDCHRKADKILFDTPRPINKIIFLYEDKNTQELKEFCVKWDDELIGELLEKYDYINDHVEREELPPRPEGATSKSCTHCRWCSFKSECWIV
jgi:hypothetical protein